MAKEEQELTKQTKEATLRRAQKITKVRTSLGLTVTAFAARCGYLSSTISRLEQSEHKISNEILEKISEVYGVNLSWLMDETDEGDENHVDDAYMFTAEKSYGRRFVPADSASPVEQGARVRQVYKESGLSQREFCERIGTSLSNLHDIMLGKRKLTIRFAEKIEKAFDIGVDWLLFGSEGAKDYPCGDEMILFLKQNPEIRKEIWEKMRGQGEEEGKEQK